MLSTPPLTSNKQLFSATPTPFLFQVKSLRRCLSHDLYSAAYAAKLVQSYLFSQNPIYRRSRGAEGGGDDTAATYAEILPRSDSPQKNTSKQELLPKCLRRTDTIAALMVLFFVCFSFFFYFLKVLRKCVELPYVPKSQHVNSTNYFNYAQNIWGVKWDSVLPVFLFLSGMCIYPAGARRALASQRDFNLKVAKWLAN